MLFYDNCLGLILFQQLIGHLNIQISKVNLGLKFLFLSLMDLRNQDLS